MLSDEEIDKLYEIDGYIEEAEKANVLYIERYDIWQMDTVTLKALAKLISSKAIEAEREACAYLCETEWSTDSEHRAGIMFAEAIRARGQT